MRQVVMVVALAAVAACGGGSESGGGSGPAGTADVQDFTAKTSAISAATTAYGSSAASMADFAACTADESAYVAQIGPMLDDLRSRSGAMDARMASMGHAADADMACGVDAMLAEVQLHGSVACASGTDMDPNKSEAARHVDVMSAWADHQRVRAEQTGSMMGMAGMQGGTTGTCQQNADGTYTMTNGAARPTVTTMTVMGFRAGAQDIAADAGAYGATAGTMADVAACRADEAAYDSQVRPLVEQMTATASAMDERMTAMGGQGTSADMQCGVDAMRWELDHHAALACTSSGDMTPNRTEVTRHVQSMTEWADHQRVRSEQMGSMMGMAGMPGSGSSGVCQRNADGSYTLTGGGMMP